MVIHKTSHQEGLVCVCDVFSRFMWFSVTHVDYISVYKHFTQEFSPKTSILKWSSKILKPDIKILKIHIIPFVEDHRRRWHRTRSFCPCMSSRCLYRQVYNVPWVPENGAGSRQRRAGVYADRVDTNNNKQTVILLQSGWVYENFFATLLQSVVARSMGEGFCSTLQTSGLRGHPVAAATTFLDERNRYLD